MPSILPGIRFAVKDKLCNQLRRCRLAAVRIRYLIIINLLNGRSAYQTAKVLLMPCASTTVDDSRFF